jgi:hypothetical protein
MSSKNNDYSESTSEDEIKPIKKVAKKEEVGPMKEIMIEKKIATDKKNDIEEYILPTEGIKRTDPRFKKNVSVAVCCEYCDTLYDKRMVTKCEIGDIMCQHCYFFFNFADPDAKYGWTLEKYIDLCHHEHDRSKCHPFKNGGGCHLCLYLCDMECMAKNSAQSKTNSGQKVDLISRKIVFSDESHKDKLHISCDEMIVL